MYIDIFLAIFILIGLIQGYHRGIIRTLFAVLGVCIGFLAALKFSPYVVTLIEGTFGLSPLISMILGLLLTFSVLLFGIRWLGKSFENTLKVVRLNLFNKLAGAAVFAALMIIVYSAVIWFLDRTNMLQPMEKASSRSYPALQEVPALTSSAFEKIKPVFREFWDKMDAVLTPPQEGTTEQ